MNKVTYELVKEKFKDEDLGDYISYGIEVKKCNETEMHISDVFINKVEADKFIKLCNETELDPIHLEDVILDTLGRY